MQNTNEIGCVIKIEVWKKINEFPNYSISNCGRVRNDETNYIRKNTLNNTGYWVVSFKDGTKSTIRLIHRLVAIAFIENSDPEKDCINHIDGDKLNNNPSNLEWCTKGENNRHAYATGLAKTEKPVRSICVSTGEEREYPSAREAHRQTGIDYRQISDVCRGAQKTAHGYYWKFI